MSLSAVDEAVMEHMEVLITTTCEGCLGTSTVHTGDNRCRKFRRAMLEKAARDRRKEEARAAKPGAVPPPKGKSMKKLLDVPDLSSSSSSSFSPPKRGAEAAGGSDDLSSAISRKREELPPSPWEAGKRRMRAKMKPVPEKEQRISLWILYPDDDIEDDAEMKEDQMHYKYTPRGRGKV